MEELHAVSVLFKIAGFAQIRQAGNPVLAFHPTPNLG